MIRLGDVASAAGYSLVSLQSVDSTNRLALDLAQQAGANRTWVVSEVQREGRGRHGRVWESPAGNLYATLLLVAPCTVADSPKLGFAAGVALAETLKALRVPGDVRLKWPNDVLVDGGKLAGILLEGRMINADKQAVAIGMGLNIVSAPEIPGRQTVSLRGLGADVTRETVFRTLSEQMSAAMTTFARGAGFYSIRDAWSRMSLPPGTPITVKVSAGEHAGRFAGIDGQGRLKLDTAAGQMTLDAGDVFVTSAG